MNNENYENKYFKMKDDNKINGLKKLFNDIQHNNSSYGTGAEKPDMDKNAFRKKKTIYNILKKMAEQREFIEKNIKLIQF